MFSSWYAVTNSTSAEEPSNRAATDGRFSPLPRGIPGAVRLEQDGQCLLAGRDEPVRGGGVPTSARRDIAQELVDGRQGAHLQRDVELPAAGPRELNEHRHDHGGKRSRGHAVAEEHPGETAEQVREDDVVLEADGDPERDARDRRFAVIEPVPHHHPHALHEQQRQQHRDVAAPGRPGRRIAISNAATRREMLDE